MVNKLVFMRKEIKMKENCKFYDRKKKTCISLNDLYCQLEPNRKCKFYKEKEEKVNETK